MISGIRPRAQGFGVWKVEGLRSTTEGPKV